MQIFMERSGDCVFYRGPDCVGSESCPQPLSEAGRTSSIISWMPGQLSYSRLRHCTADRSFPERGMFPVLPVRMRLSGLRHCGMGCRQRNSKKNELDGPAHYGGLASGLPRHWVNRYCGCRSYAAA
jgi:hypothetical protein